MSSNADGQKSSPKSSRLIAAIAATKREMTPAERETQRRSFAFGNANIHNPAITRELIDEQAEALK